MDVDKYERSVSMHCPTCGNTQFSSSEDQEETLTCALCERVMTRDELVRENEENISEHLKEIRDQASKDIGEEIKRSLMNAFKGNKYIRIK